MDPSLTRSNKPVEQEKQKDDWDTDGFVIPSLSVGDTDLSNQDVPEQIDVKYLPKVIKEEEKIYLGPHGAPPSQAKQQQLDLNTAGRKQRFKQKLKEADRRYSGTGGHENKVEHIRELVVSRVSNPSNTNMMAKASPRDWLDPHCHESQFERYIFSAYVGQFPTHLHLENYL